MKKTEYSIKTPLVNYLLALTCFFSPYALSEITLDGSMGTTASLAGPDYQITEDLGRRAGSNLFHSFGQFNISSTESATFSGSNGIKNIISRVTNGQASTIDGTFRSTIPSANMYFLNPSGVIFGENASLDIQGSFHPSTAEFLKFNNGVKFETKLANTNPILTTVSPEAFGFLDDTPATITILGGNNSVLEVPEDETLSFVGGNIFITNRSLYAPNGRVILASIGSAGEVGMNESGIDTASFTNMGSIHIIQTSDHPILDSSGDSGGEIIIDAGSLRVVDSATILAATREKKVEVITAKLPKSLPNVSDLLGKDCSSRSEKNLNSFLVKNRDGLPASPGKLVPSDFLDY